MNFSEKVKCDSCHETKLRGETLLVDTPKGRFRMCRACYATYGASKLNDNYQTAKDNISALNIEGMDAYDVIKRQEDFIKNIKEGRLHGNR